MKRELPSETRKITCNTLRNRNNIFKRPCSTQYESESQCNSAYSSQDNFYQPCVWHADVRACVESGQSLACDCELRHTNCPHHPQHDVEATANQPVIADAGGESGSPVVMISLLVIVGGLGSMAWLYVRKRSRSENEDDVDGDGDGDPDAEPAAAPKKRKKKKEKNYGNTAEMESMEL